MYTYRFFFSICFILGALYTVLGSRASIGTKQTGLLLSWSWQTSWPCSGFQWNCKEAELPLNILLLRKALKRCSVFTSFNEKVKSLSYRNVETSRGGGGNFTVGRREVYTAPWLSENNKDIYHCAYPGRFQWILEKNNGANVHLLKKISQQRKIYSVERIKIFTYLQIYSTLNHLQNRYKVNSEGSK